MEQPTMDNQLRECVSCADGEDVNQLLLMPCDQHFFHRSCLVELFEKIIATAEGEDLYPPNCCGVKHPILIEQVQDIFTIDFVERWHAKELEYLTPKPLRVHCASAKCGRFIPIGEHHEDHLKSIAICSSCQTSTCTGCKQVREDDLHRCPLDKDIEAAIEYRPDHRVKRCPSCSVFVEHTDACNHMTCVNCTHEFCFVCLEPYGQEEERCNCPMYGDPQYDTEGYDADGFHRDTGLDREGYGRRGYNRAGVNRAGEHRPTSTNIHSRIPERIRWLQEQARLHQQEETRIHQAIMDLENGIIQQNDFGLDDDEAWDMLDGDNPNGDDFDDDDDFRDDHADEQGLDDVPLPAWLLDRQEHQRDIPIIPPAPATPAPPTEDQIYCTHDWQFRYGGSRCRLCQWRSDIFHMRCDRCHLDVCRDCSHRFNYNLQRFWPRAESYGVDILHEIFEAAYAEANPFEHEGFAIDIMHEEAERLYRERHPFEHEGFAIDLMYEEAEAQYRERHPFEHEGFGIDVLHRKAEREYASAQFEKGYLPEDFVGQVTGTTVRMIRREKHRRSLNILNSYQVGSLVKRLWKKLEGFEPLGFLLFLIALSVLESVLSGS